MYVVICVRVNTNLYFIFKGWNYVLTTSDGLMIYFDIYNGAKSMFGDTNFGWGPSIVLHLAKSIPSGNCVYHDRYFTTVFLIEEMENLNLHYTGRIMQNQILVWDTIKFKKYSQMRHGEWWQFVCKRTVIVKWKDNKSVLLASNCTGSGTTTNVRRLDKNCKNYVAVSAAKIVQNNNQYMRESMCRINKWNITEFWLKLKSGHWS